MEPINVMVNGLPGNMAIGIARHVLADERFSLIPQSLTGPEIDDTEIPVAGLGVTLIRPDSRQGALERIKSDFGQLITVDFTHPSAVKDNAAFYCEQQLPFVMGTTGGDRDKLIQMVSEAGLSAVIAPNMGKQIVGFQAMMDYAATNFPGLFEGYRLQIKESHQAGKADTSGTAKAMLGYFNDLGASHAGDPIAMERDPAVQKSDWQIPEEYLTGHAWHTYSLDSDDGTVHFSFTHNVNGREIYMKGTLDAIAFLSSKIAQGEPGRIYTMIDILKAGKI
ncbi:MAG: dihydrodipicolinate reductase [Deltaproteobacteria bacterium]|nr:dihydrodipicolinate reductase [Deltaproteobacteria bacterium]